MSSASKSRAPLSIGFLSPGWPFAAYPNGIVGYIETLAPTLISMGHRVSVVAAKAGEGPFTIPVYDVDQDQRTRGIGRRLLDSLAYRIDPDGAARRMNRRQVALTVQRAVREQGLHIFEMEESFGLAEVVRERLSIPICVRLHGPWFLNGQALNVAQDEAYRQRVRDEEIAIRSALAITAPSLDVLQRTRDFYNLPLADARVIPATTPPVPMPERWRLDRCDQDLIVFVGRFDRHKGGDLMIEAFRMVLAEVPSARLRFVGPDRGCIDEGGKDWTLLDFVRDKLPGALESGRMEWLGQRPFSELANHRRAGMTTVVCSRYENFPLAAVESMALGCPTVAANAGGIPEIVEHGRNGLLHAPADPADIAAKIIEMMRNPDRAAELGRQAGVDCESRFYPEPVAAQTLEFYRWVLGRQSTMVPGLPTE